MGSPLIACIKLCYALIVCMRSKSHKKLVDIELCDLEEYLRYVTSVKDLSYYADSLGHTFWFSSSVINLTHAIQ